MLLLLSENSEELSEVGQGRRELFVNEFEGAMSSGETGWLAPFSINRRGEPPLVSAAAVT